jgi:hypothetical protein
MAILRPNGFIAGKPAAMVRFLYCKTAGYLTKKLNLIFT